MSIEVGILGYNTAKKFIAGNVHKLRGCPSKGEDTEKIEEKIIMEGETIDQAIREVKNDIRTTGCNNVRNAAVEKTRKGLHNALEGAAEGTEDAREREQAYLDERKNSQEAAKRLL